MLRKSTPYIILVILFTTGVYAAIVSMGEKSEGNDTTQTQNAITQKTQMINKQTPKKKTVTNSLYEPVPEFKKRITKKKFGIYSTPDSSPIPNERFTGWHTGVDVEYADITKTIPVHSVASGTIAYSGWVSGYGGVALLTHKIKGANRTVVYGHLAPSSLLAVGTKVKANQVIGKLGENNSSETDGERKHLHFGILSDNRQDFRGYVSTEAQLSNWLNPTDLY